MQPELPNVTPWNSGSPLQEKPIERVLRRHVLPLDFLTLRNPLPEHVSLDATHAVDLRLEIEQLNETIQTQQRKIECILADSEAHRLEESERAQLELAAETQRHQNAVLEMVTEFRKEREKYFRSIEEQAVRLALSIAERILHHEAAIDSLFLRGAVHVALAELPGETDCVLHVAPEDAETWRTWLQAEAHATLSVESDEQLVRGQCRLSAKVGSVDLSARAQLLDIETGFLELLQKRPA